MAEGDKKIVGIEFIEASQLPLKKQVELGISSGFVEVRRERGSLLKTKFVVLKGLPSDKLMKKISESQFKDTPLIN